MAVSIGEQLTAAYKHQKQNRRAPDMPDMQPHDSALEFIRRITIDDLDSLDSFD